MLEVLGAGPAGERGEGDPGPCGLVEVVRDAERLLLVGARDVHLLLPLERPQAVGGVILRGWDVPDDTFLPISASCELKLRTPLTAICFWLCFHFQHDTRTLGKAKQGRNETEVRLRQVLVNLSELSDISIFSDHNGFFNENCLFKP